MEPLRKPLQGIWNIIRFNWHQYLLALMVIMLLLAMGYRASPWNYIAVALVTGVMLVSLAISFYIYDISALYRFTWLPAMDNPVLVNIHAGFDETSALLKARYPSSTLQVFDFYDPQKHTEISIKRARKAYPPYPGTAVTRTSAINLPALHADYITVTLAAHEIRDMHERIQFFTELERILKPGGEIAVTEHLRDMPNFLAYNIGYLHFLPYNTWRQTFRQAGLQVHREIKTTPFITTFILKKNGPSS